MDVDFARMESLLNVVHLCAGVGPKLTSLSNAAMTELTKVNDEIREASMTAEKERIVKEAAAQPKAIPSKEFEEDEPKLDLSGKPPAKPPVIERKV